jgi:sugar phosphate isomerase/epimerase
MEIFFSKMSAFGLPMGLAMKMVQEAGFDGMEILLNGFSHRIPKYKELAEELGLDLHFHQAWSADEDPTDKKFKLLELIGYLPSEGYTILDQVDYLDNQILIIQADRIQEVSRNPEWRNRWNTNMIAPNFWFQTDSSFNDGQPLVPFSQFVDYVQRFNASVVFDTQHYIEYVLGQFRNISAFPEPAKIFELLQEGWELLGSHVKEIHLNDCSAELGRNIFPGTGTMPLQDFCWMVEDSDWQGTIVPEVSPTILFPYRLQHLKELRSKVESYFA